MNRIILLIHKIVIKHLGVEGVYLQLIQKHFLQLSEVQKKVASYILEFPYDVALRSAQDIGDLLGVSVTTMNRFCYAIELSGYSELQSIVRRSLMKSKSPNGIYLASKNEISAADRFFIKQMETNTKIIQRVAENLNQKDFLSSCKCLHEAKKIYILGLNSSFAAAVWFGFTLKHLRSDIILMDPQSQDTMQLLRSMQKGEVLVVLSFHRYVKQILDMTRNIKQKGVTIIGISDIPTASISQHCDYYFPLGTSKISTIDLMPTVISFLNTLVSGMTIQNPQQYEMYKTKFNSLDCNCKCP